jgi:transposase-like protein
MTSCPECASAKLTNPGTEHGERQDDEHAVTVAKYRCESCGCEFEVTERTEWETEVTKHGDNCKDEEVE